MSHPRPAPPNAEARPRVVFLDALRLIATFQMVQGHTLDAVLATGLRAGAWFRAWEVTRGLTAVAFLFAAGLAFHQSVLVAGGGQVGRRRRRVRRAVMLVVIGYALHTPVWMLISMDTVLRAEGWRQWLRVDVLHCIGVTLLYVEALAWISPCRRVLAAVAAATGVALIIVAPAMQTLPVDGPMRPLLAFISPTGGSIFPLVPWSAHLLFGVATAELAAERWVRGLASAAVMLALFGVLAGMSTTFSVSAMHLHRVAVVAMVAAMLAAVVRRRMPRWLEGLCSQTLAIYVFHILLVYGAGVGVADWIGPTLGLVPALAVTGLVMAASVAVARFGPRMR